MAFEQGAVLVLPFPYSDRLAEKRRPALVVSRAGLQREHGVIWVAMITSAGGRPREGDVVIPDSKRAGLPAPSLVRPVKLATIEPARVLRVAGAVTPSLLKRVLAVIRAQL
jgi:mRNA interferase MazF